MKNKVDLIGLVGKDPEIKSVGEKKVANFSLATSHKFKGKNGERKEQTQWHNIVIWSPLAEIVEKYVKKGAKLNLGGMINYRSYDDKEGNKKYITEIICNELLMLDGKASEPSSNTIPGNDKDDLPF